MLRVLLLDLGETLVSQNLPLPGVSAALTALQVTKCRDGSSLEMALVSDYKMASSPQSPEVATFFHEYCSLLEGFSLGHFFHPYEMRVTLSTHAGVFKPARSVFELALTRLSSPASLAECLFVTENAAHIEACRGFGMTALQFGHDFEGWIEGLDAIQTVISGP